MKCGSCTVVCPVYRVTGRESQTARGRMHLLTTGLTASPSTTFANLFTSCLLCGRCSEVCSRSLPITRLMVEARQRLALNGGRHRLVKSLVRTTLSRPDMLALLGRGTSLVRLIGSLPLSSGLRLRLGLIEGAGGERPAEVCTESPPGEHPEEKRPGQALAYFKGCFASYLQPSIGRAVVSLVQATEKRDPLIPDDQACCGLAAWSAGKIKEAERLAAANIRSFARWEGPILTSCGSCFAHLRRYPDLFAKNPVMRAKAEWFSSRVVEITTYLADPMPMLQENSGQGERVWYHQPCHLRPFPETARAARELLAGTGRLQPLTPADQGHCCGQGGLFHLSYPEISRQIFRRCFEELRSTRPQVVTSTCSGCLMQFQVELAREQSEIRVDHLAVLLARAMEIS